MKIPTVVVVGSSNTDMVVKVPSFPKPGETVLGEDLVTAAGGKGANQAVAAARLGAAVTLVARLGSDAFGDQALSKFELDGLKTAFLIRDENHPSGVALILVDEEGENVIAVASGANAHLTGSDVERALPAISNADVLLLQLEVPLDTVRCAAEHAQKSGVRVILNPAPAQTLDPGLLGCVTTLTPNSGETKILTGIDPVDESSAQKAALRLMSFGVKEVVITLGERGAFVAIGDEMHLVPGRRVKAVDTTAAGDAFNGALAYALGSGRNLVEGVEFANRVAAYSVTRLGAQPSLPTMADLGV